MNIQQQKIQLALISSYCLLHYVLTAVTQASSHMEYMLSSKQIKQNLLCMRGSQKYSVYTYNAVHALMSLN